MSSDATANPTFPPSAEMVARAHADEAKYNEMYAASINDPEAFWGEHGKRVDWIKPFTKVKNTSFEPGKIDIKWFEDGTLNVSANCIDRHLETRGNQTAIIFEPDDPKEQAQSISYADLHRRVCRMANILEDLGVRKGDRVIIYLPMIPEAAYAMLACARIGAIHSIVFRGLLAPTLSPPVSTVVTPRWSSPLTPHRAVAARHALKSNVRRSPPALQRHCEVPCCKAHRRPDHLDRRT